MQVEKLSVYILSFNNEPTILKAIESVLTFADELVIVDSGSTDKTLEICQQFTHLIYSHKFVNFKEQRNFAMQKCTNNWIFTIDSDETLDQKAINELEKLKPNLAMLKKWEAFGLKVTNFYKQKALKCFFPMNPRHFVIRLFNKQQCYFNKNSNADHVSLSGIEKKTVLAGSLNNYTANSFSDLMQKQKRSTKMQAFQISKKSYFQLLFKLIFSPFFTFFKWYFKNQLFTNGRSGLEIAIFASIYTQNKYFEALQYKLRGN